MSPRLGSKGAALFAAHSTLGRVTSTPIQQSILVCSTVITSTEICPHLAHNSDLFQIAEMCTHSAYKRREIHKSY